MLSRRLRERVPSAMAMGRVDLPGWTVAFHKRSVDGSGKCSIVAAEEPEAVAYGVVFALEPHEKPRLDEAEWLGCGYRCEELQIELNDEPISVFTYVAQSAYVDDALLPYGWYRDFVVAGAREHGLPRRYVSWLLQQPVQSDPDRARAAENVKLLALDNMAQVSTELVQAQKGQREEESG